MKFTFKTEKPTGRWRSFDSDYHVIKLDGSQVGESYGDPFKIRLMVLKDDVNEDGNPNCEWKWITLKGDFKSLQEAKDFLNRNVDIILDKFKIHKLE